MDRFLDKFNYYLCVNTHLLIWMIKMKLKYKIYLAILLVVAYLAIIYGPTVITKYNNATTGYNNVTAAYDNVTAVYNNSTRKYNNLTAAYNNVTAAYNNATAAYNNVTTAYNLSLI